MGTTSSTLRGLMANARRSAQRRKQRPSTAHALLVMLQHDGETSRVLSRRGVREMDLISALKVANEEPTSAVEVAAERAARIAQNAGGTPARALHLLAAIVREPRCAGFRCLEASGTNVARLREDVSDALGVEDDRTLTRAPGLARGRARPTVPPVPRTRVPQRPPRNQRKPSPPSDEPAGAIPRTPERPVARLGSELPGNGLGGKPPARKRPSAARRFDADGVKDPGADDRGPHDLAPGRFPLLTCLGRNLTSAAAAGEIDPVVGREHELDRLLDVLGRRRANNPVLVGPPGVGKTAIVEGLALKLVEDGEACGRLADRILIEISAGALVSGTGVRGALAEKLRQLREEVAKADGKVLLFLDEIHAIVGGEGPDDLANELKAALARGELPCIGATTEAEYTRYFERDAALARRFSRIDVGEPTPAEAVEILRGLAPKYELHHAVAYEPVALKAAVELTVRYVPEGFLPDKAIAVLDLAAARVRRRGGSVVDTPSVARVVSEQAHIPVDRLLMRDADRLLRLDAHLRERVVGQREPLGRIADALRKGAAGFRGRRPLGTFLLLGPTGVGKTETAKAISDLLFPSSGVTRFDMSEFSEPHAVARLLGAPPGYVGHEEGGQLTESVRRRPYQLILLDEIEKAHPEVLLSLLPLLDEGRMTDGRGRTVDFTNTVIVMTSNLGAGAATASGGRVGFGARDDARCGADRTRDRVLSAARRALPPELWNRIDEPLFFAPLGTDEVRAIAARLLDEVAEVMRREHRVGLEVEPTALDALIEAGGFDPELGARPMRRCVGRLVEAPLASAVLSGEAVRGTVVVLRGDGDRVVLEPKNTAEAAE
ncbi:MAG TPA: ATP-dependent Clp protease ATP-binding subunit [Sandaracinaceae bacterium LLY-WYZ-13_1]|nr:ATP-dependent Clp protease ATP-binding subunit [Sandaracinaceae bacterium LLY-WYZ-13_1]